jgi:hypothetical protein
MRTIHLRETDIGEWFVGVTTNPNVYHSFQLFETRAQAVRGFVIEGRHQPFARMVVQARRGDRQAVVRESQRAGYTAAKECVVLAAVKAALLMPHSRAAWVRDTDAATASSTPAPP